MTDQIISHYKILAKLGEGGMGVVYKAEDTKLKRSVALKFLPPHLTQDQEAIERFIYEAQTASSLDHQNICTIYEIDETEDGQMFIAMAYYEGETLQQRIARGEGRRAKGEERGAPITPRPSPFTIAEAIDIAIQIAQGLAKAHEKGIVHRDLKPSNLIVQRDGVVKIIDFGLSKLLGTKKLTKSGATMGTVAYMSPEQARGKEVDQRTDLWSLGVVLYEMLTGQLPFRGERDQAVIYSILDEQPEPVANLCSNVPAELEWIINKALAKNPSERYQHADEMLGELRLLKKKIESGASERLRIGARPARRKKAYLYGGIAAFVILLIWGGLALFNGRSEAIDSVAVLPFENANADPETDYLSDGITESLIYSLSQLPKLKVIARSSVFRYKGQAIDPQAAARELGVRVVVMGRIVQRDKDLAISAELVDGQDNRLLWGRQYNRRLSGLLTVQEELAREITDKLRPELRREEKQQATKSYTESTEAYQLYLKGRYFWNKRTEEGLRKGIEYFQQAIAKDSTYAKAYAGLTDCYFMLAEEIGYSPTEHAKARAAAMKALELDETLAEAHTSLGGLIAHHDWDWLAAEKELKRAIELNPNDATAHEWYSICLELMGRSDEALAEAKRAVESDPLTSIINQSFGDRLYMARQYDRAIEQLQQALEIDATFYATYETLGFIYVQKGMYEKAIAAFQKAKQLYDYPEILTYLGYGYAMSGKRDEARKIIAELKERAQRRYVSTYHMAIIYVGLGEKDEAFAWLEKAYEEHNAYLVFLKVDPIWDSLRSDSRYTALLKKAGLE